MTADVILSALRAAPDGLTRSELFAAGNRKWRADDLTAALDQLETQGVITRERVNLPKGRPAERWRLISHAESSQDSGQTSETPSSPPRDTLQFMADRWFAAQRRRLGLEGRP